MKIRNLTLAAVVSASVVSMQVLGAGSAQALESRPGIGILKSQDGGQTWHATAGGTAEGNTYYVGTANGGVWKTTDGGSSAPARPVPTGQVVFHVDGN